MAFRELTLSTGTKIILGKDEDSNDELMKIFKGKENIILHTRASGSPFGVIDKIKPTKKEIYETGVIVARHSQDWRDNQKNVIMDVFTGKNISKRRNMKKGSWNVKKSKNIEITKLDIKKLI